MGPTWGSSGSGAICEDSRAMCHIWEGMEGTLDPTQGVNLHRTASEQLTVFKPKKKLSEPPPCIGHTCDVEGDRHCVLPVCWTRGYSMVSQIVRSDYQLLHARGRAVVLVEVRVVLQRGQGGVELRKGAFHYHGDMPVAVHLMQKHPQLSLGRLRKAVKQQFEAFS